MCSFPADLYSMCHFPHPLSSWEHISWAPFICRTSFALSTLYLHCAVTGVCENHYSRVEHLCPEHMCLWLLSTWPYLKSTFILPHTSPPQLIIISLALANNPGSILFSSAPTNSDIGRWKSKGDAVVHLWFLLHLNFKTNCLGWASAFLFRQCWLHSSL